MLFRSAVSQIRGSNFAKRHITERNKRFFADIVSMNDEILKNAGVFSIDKSERCTSCDPDLFHSHRKTNGKRGTMGAVIGLPE